MAGFNHFADVANALHGACAKVVKKTCFDGQANIQGYIRMNGQIDTGFMLNSVYVKLIDASTYGQGGIEPPKDASLLPEVDTPPDDVTGYIAVGANYAIYQNYGTRHLPARPFFEPGIEATRPGFVAALTAVIKAMEEAAK
jgi:hypothetical protein